jgi:hypothetical protein
MFLECAALAKVDLLVAGDENLLTFGAYREALCHALGIPEGEISIAVIGPVPGWSGAGSGPKTMPGWFHPGSLDSSVDGNQKASSAGLRFLSQTDGLYSSGAATAASNGTV